MILLLTGCSRKEPASDFPKIAEEFVYRSLAFSPINATAQGLHTFEKRKLDSELDDYNRDSIQVQREFYSGIHKKLVALDRDGLSEEDKADFDIIDTHCGLALFDLDIARTWNRNPTLYVEAIGTALFAPYQLEYAPKPERFGQIIARLKQLPGFVKVAQQNLWRVPDIWRRVAIEENQGNIDLIEKTLAPACSKELRPEFDKAADDAKYALRGFNKFLEDKGVPNPKQERRGPPDNSAQQPDWRLGADMYAVKFKLSLATDSTPDEVLKDAETRLREVRAKMLELARALYKGQAGASDDDTIRNVLNAIATRHSTPASYLDDARNDLAEARDFVRAKHLMTLPARDNLQVIPTPEFMRGIYAVGGFNPAPALEPQLGAFYWVTPIPPSWPKERAESKLREYNFFKLKLLTIHEAMPGHYVQGEISNDIPAKTRRVLRSIYGNNPYIEGWAQYATQTMLDAGFLDNSPELRLTFLKEELRVIANAIVDIRLQSNKMTEQEALDMMEKQTFQEHEEAVAKVRRAQLSSAQLPTYFVGWRDWQRVRDAVKVKQGAAFDAAKFHDRALEEGAVPLPVLQRLLTGGK